MVESLRELNKICQKADYKTKGNWYVRTILRDAALPTTWLLLHTRVTADQVTLLSLIVSFAGMFCLSLSGNMAFLAGAALLQLWYYLDHVDGQIARYRKTDCLTGRFLDFMTHHLVHAVLFFALGFYGYNVTWSAAYIIWGFASALAIMIFNMTHDVKYKTFFEKFLTDGLIHGNFRGATFQKEDNPPNAAKETVPLSRKIFSFLHKLCEIHVMMNVLTLAALVHVLAGGPDLRMLFFVAYGLIAPVVAVIQLVYILKTRKVDREYDELFGPSGR